MKIFITQSNCRDCDDAKFILVHQTQWQQELLVKYGDICLLDATYRTCNFDIPLFFLCVNTNVGYSIVGTFMLENENTESIKEALNIVKSWNQKWKPTHFVTDYDEREISAIKQVFNGGYKV